MTMNISSTPVTHRMPGTQIPPKNQLECAHLVVARESVNTALHENEAELAVLVLAVELQVLAHGHCLLDQVVQVLWDLRRQAQPLQDAQDLGACHSAHLQPSTSFVSQEYDPSTLLKLPSSHYLTWQRQFTTICRLCAQASGDVAESRQLADMQPNSSARCS